MKFILIEAYYELDKLKYITYNSIRKIKKKYYMDCLFKVKYQNEYLSDVIINLTKKVNLEKLPLIINYHFDTLTFLNLSLPKMNNSELLKNIDLEISNLVYDYKTKFNYMFDRLGGNNSKNYRAILYPKLGENEIINKDLLKAEKIKKVVKVIDYSLVEGIMSKYKYRNNVNYSIIYFKDKCVEINVLCNGKVIEYFKFIIEEELLDVYNSSHNYEELFNVNNQYFKSLCDFINSFIDNRVIICSIMLFTLDYNEYLKNMINEQIKGTHYVKDYIDCYASVLEDKMYE